MPNLLIQGIGFLALLAGVLSFQTNVRRRLLYLQILASVLWVIHFGLLGALTAAALNGVGTIRTIVFARVPLAARRSRWLAFGLVLAVYIVATWLTWNGPISLLPLGGSFFSSLALWQHTARRIRWLSLPDPPLWFSYNFLVHSYPGMLNEVIVFGAVLIAIYRLDIRKLPDPSGSGSGGSGSLSAPLAGDAGGDERQKQ